MRWGIWEGRGERPCIDCKGDEDSSGKVCLDNLLRPKFKRQVALICPIKVLKLLRVRDIDNDSVIWLDILYRESESERVVGVHWTEGAK